MTAHAQPAQPHRHGVLSILTETAASWVQDNAMRLSASLSLYAILSLAPLLVITFKVVGMVIRNRDYARREITEQLSNLMGPQAAQAIGPMVESGSKAGHGVLSTIVSTAVLIFSATGVFAELQNAMNNIWGVQLKPNQGMRGYLRNRLLSAGMVFAIAFLLLISMFISALLATLARYITSEAKPFTFAADVVVSLVIITLLFAACFKFLPDAEIPWRLVWGGAAVTAVLFTVGKYILTLYFKFAAPTSAFGAAGSLAAVLLWVYYSSFILFFGAELTKTWAIRHGHAVVPNSDAVMVPQSEHVAAPLSG